MPVINYYRLHVVNVSINHETWDMYQFRNGCHENIRFSLSLWQIDDCSLGKKKIFNHFSCKSPSTQSGRHRVISPLHEGLVGPTSLPDEGKLMWWRHNPALKYLTMPAVCAICVWNLCNTFERTRHNFAIIVMADLLVVTWTVQ